MNWAGRNELGPYRCRLASGTISLLVGALAAAGASSLSTSGERHVSRVRHVYKATQGRPLAPIRPANAAAQLVLRTQAGRKEEGPHSAPHRPRPYNDCEKVFTAACFCRCGEDFSHA